MGSSPLETSSPFSTGPADEGWKRLEDTNTGTDKAGVIPKAANTGLPSPKLFPRKRRDANETARNGRTGKRNNWVQNFPENPIYPAYVGLNQPASTGTGQYYYAPGEGGTAAAIPFSSRLRGDMGRGGGESVLHESGIDRSGQWNDTDLAVQLGPDGYVEYAWDTNFERKPGKTWFPKKDKDVSMFPYRNQTNMPTPPNVMDIGQESLFYPLEGRLNLVWGKDIDWKNLDPNDTSGIKVPAEGDTKKKKEDAPSGEEAKPAVQESEAAGPAASQKQVEAGEAVQRAKKWGFGEPVMNTTLSDAPKKYAFAVPAEPGDDSGDSAVLEHAEFEVVFFMAKQGKTWVPAEGYILFTDAARSAKEYGVSTPDAWGKAFSRKVFDAIPNDVIKKAGEAIVANSAPAADKKAPATKETPAAGTGATAKPAEADSIEAMILALGKDPGNVGFFLPDKEMSPELKKALDAAPNGAGKKLSWYRWDNDKYKDHGVIVQKA